MKKILLILLVLSMAGCSILQKDVCPLLPTIAPTIPISICPAPTPTQVALA